MALPALSGLFVLWGKITPLGNIQARYIYPEFDTIVRKKSPAYPIIKGLQGIPAFS